MKNKKGDIKISYLIGGIIGLFVLGAVIYLLANSGGDLSKYVDWIIPDKNETKEGVAGIEIFRYDIIGGNAEYYDGTKWMAFEEIVIGGKKVNAGGLKKDFEKGYYESGRGKSAIKLGYELMSILAQVNLYNKDLIDEASLEYLRKNYGDMGKLSMMPFTFYIPSSSKIVEGYRKDLGFFFKSEKDKTGSVKFLLVKSDDIGIGGRAAFILGLNDEFGIEYEKDDSLKYDYKGILSHDKGLLFNIFNVMKEWRNSVFKKPILFNYIKKEGKEEKSCSGEYSAVLKDNRYIVTDLGKRVGEEKC